MATKKTAKKDIGSNLSTQERIKALYTDDSLIDAEEDYDAYVYGGLSTGSLSLDMIIGRPGIPMGRLTEIAAEDDSGKTALALELVFQAQKKRMLVIVDDTERTWEDKRLDDRGIDKSRLLFMRTDYLEDTFERIEKIVDSLLPSEEALIIIDSIAGCTTKREYESDYDDYNVGTHASVLAKGFRKLIPRISQNSPKEKNKKKVAFVVVNQLKENVSLNPYMRGKGRLKHFGGYAVKYHATLRLVLDKEDMVYDSRVSSTAKRKDKGDPIGLKIRMTTIKNKVAVPYREASFILNFARGIDAYEDLFNAGINLGLIENKAAFYYYKGGKGFHSKNWNEIVMKAGGSGKMYQEMLKEAYKMGHMRPYGGVKSA